MGGYLGQLQLPHHGFSSCATLGHAEGYHATASLRQILLGELIGRVSRKRGVEHPAHLGVGSQGLGYAKAVLGMACHAQVEALQPQIDEEGILRGLDGAQVPHELGCGLGDEGSLQPEVLSVDDTVIALIWLA